MASIGGVRLTFQGNGVAMRREYHVRMAQQRLRTREAAEAALENDRGRSAQDVLQDAVVADTPIGQQRYAVTVPALTMYIL